MLGRMDQKNTVREIKEYLKKQGCKTSFKTKADALSFIESLHWVERFPWNEDQQKVLGWENDAVFNEHVIQGTFGSGKSTMMMGIYTKKIRDKVLSPDQILVCAFNISIKNELKKKIRLMGFKQKPQVRTFDSLVYEICHKNGMEGLEKPDYEGRRTFVEKLLTCSTKYEDTVYSGIRFVLVDEAQDLDQTSLLFFRAFFPNARFYFFGDVFQCIQKEPRCSLLWKLLQPEKDRVIYFMKQTPRVPTPILSEIKNALVHHYPEYTEEINGWYSGNPLTDPEIARIKWVSFRQYAEIFKRCKEFLDQHDPKDCMVLTFSSAITVRGNMGDLSRFRQFFLQENIPVNRNYKTMDADRLFLSTVNSSKGLERKHVFIALSFPLELAFANFSNNLVVNLVSVGLSRCKQDVVFCVPAYEDRFSDVLRLYPCCPLPKLDSPSMRKLKSTQDKKRDTLTDYLFRSHSATEIIRQSILSFSTREEFRSRARMMKCSVVFPPGERVKWRMRSEEEASFMGVLYEVLITSIWTNAWPPLDTCFITDVATNPLYKHLQIGINQQFQRLLRSFRLPFASCPHKFDVLYLYTEHHILLNQKIRVRVSPERKQEMKQVWSVLEPDIRRLRPSGGKLKAQVNLKRPFMTGIADLICETEDKEQIVYEIKTCTDSDWKEDAFIQAALYCAMTKKYQSTIRLLNPFRREVFEYKISLAPSEKNKTLDIADQDMLLWNLNCFLAKYKETSSINLSTFVCWCGESGIEWVAPTKTRIAVFSRQEYTALGKTNIEFSPDDPQFQHNVSAVKEKEDFMTWVRRRCDLLDIQDNDLAVDWENSFLRAVLLCVLLKKNILQI